MAIRVDAATRSRVRSMLLSGRTGKQILAEVGTSAGFISSQRDVLALSHQAGHRNELEQLGSDAPSIKDEDKQPAPPQYAPQEYFDAIADGLRQRDVESAALRHRISQLEEERRKLLSDLSQCKLQMASWSGPTALPGKSLGNGG